MRYDAVDDDMVRRNRSDREALDRVTSGTHTSSYASARAKKKRIEKQWSFPSYAMLIDTQGVQAASPPPILARCLLSLFGLSRPFDQIEYFAVRPPLRVPPERPTLPLLLLPLLLLLLLRLRSTPHRLILYRNGRFGTGAEGSDQQAVTGPVYSKRARMHS